MTPDEITMLDAVFAVQAGTLAADHGYALFEALASALPWFEAEPLAGTHPVRGADDGRGGLVLGNRAKLVLRLPEHRLDQARGLGGMRLTLAGGEMRVGETLTIRPLSAAPTLYAHFVATGSEEEAAFSADIARELEAAGIAGQFVCGRSHILKEGGSTVASRSLLVHGLKPEHSLRLQKTGLGNGRKMGRGLFVPYKPVQALQS